MRSIEIPKKLRAVLIVAAWIAVFVLGALNLFRGIGHESLWYDESYSLAAAGHPALEITPIIGEDSHPPLYFLMLRGFTLLFGRSEAAARSLSAIGIIALAGLGFFPLRRLWGEWRGLLYSALVFLSPIALAMGQEARMYAWTAFFVTAAYICVMAWRRFGKRRWLIATALASLASAYCHYYGLIAVAMVWFLVLIELMVRDRGKLPEFLIIAVVTAAAYSPWLVALASQTSRVAKNFWIGPVTGKTVMSALAYPFGYKFFAPGGAYAVFYGAAVFIAYGIALGFARKDKEALRAAMAAGAFALTLAAAVVISAAFRPILVERYMVSCLGLFLLALCYGMSSPAPALQWLPAIALYGFMNIGVINDIHGKRYNGPMHVLKRELSERVKPDDVFIHGSEHTMGVFCYYFPDNKHYLYLPEGFVPFSNYEVFAPNGSYGSDVVPFLEASAGRAWYANRPYDSLAASPPAGGPGMVFETAYRAKTFAIPDSWFQVSIEGFEIVKARETEDAE